MSSYDLIASIYDDDDIGKIANNVTNHLPLTAPQLRQAFDDDEHKEIESLIEEVGAAADENEKIAKLQNHGKTALGLLKVLGLPV